MKDQMGKVLGEKRFVNKLLWSLPLIFILLFGFTAKTSLEGSKIITYGFFLFIGIYAYLIIKELIIK